MELNNIKVNLASETKVFYKSNKKDKVPVFHLLNFLTLFLLILDIFRDNLYLDTVFNAQHL